MPYRVLIEASLAGVPAEVDAALQDRLSEIAAILDTFPTESTALWESLELGGLLLDVKCWRFVYRVDRKLRAVFVEEVLFLGD